MTTTATEALTATSTVGLLRTYAALTHRMHEGNPTGCRKCRAQVAHPSTGRCTGWTDTDTDYRAQRDLIEAELLRRTTCDHDAETCVGTCDRCATPCCRAAGHPGGDHLCADHSPR